MKQFIVRSLGLILFFSLAGLFQNTLSAQRAKVIISLDSEPNQTKAVIDVKSCAVSYDFYAQTTDGGTWDLIESGIVLQPRTDSKVDKELTKPAKATSMRLVLKMSSATCATADFQ